MKRFFLTLLFLMVTTQLSAAEPVKIGMITTLSTKAGYLGEDIRDGFQLAIDQNGGKLGGFPVELLVEDDGRKPGKGRQIAERFIQRDKVKILTGIVFSNVAMAVVPKVVREKTVYLSTNAAPSKLAGKMCHPNFFSVSYQNDNLDEVVGQYVQESGYESVYLLAPNYPAGKDHL
ncbi:MAG: ABC transporter substrate-binding protein, partial [Desulfovermiculus sp.]